MPTQIPAITFPTRPHQFPASLKLPENIKSHTNTFPGSRYLLHTVMCLQGLYSVCHSYQTSSRLARNHAGLLRPADPRLPKGSPALSGLLCFRATSPSISVYFLPALLSHALPHTQEQDSAHRRTHPHCPPPGALSPWRQILCP